MISTHTVLTGSSADANSEGLGDVDRLLRTPDQVLKRIEAGEDLAPLARTLILSIAAGAAIFGAAIGAYRGGFQIAFAAIKLPLVVLLTAAIATWSLSAVRRVVTRPWLVRRDDQPQAPLVGSVTRDLGLVLAALAYGSLVLGAMAPLVLVAMSFGASYHQLTLVVVGCCQLAGIAGLVIFLKGLSARDGRGHLLSGAVALLVLIVVGGQLTWTMRPYLVRPRASAVPFMRSLEGDLLDSVIRSFDSSLGIYSRDSAPLPEEKR